MRTIALLLAFCSCSITLVCADALAEEKPTYIQPELLVEVADLQSHLNGKQQISDRPITLIDARAFDDFKSGSIAGAVHVNVGEWKKALGNGADADAWSKQIGSVLKDSDSTVVVCDYAISGNGARAWWILKYWGVEDVRLLNGGFAAWKEAGGELSVPSAAQNATPVQFEAKAQPERLATIEEVRKAIAEAGGKTCLVDTRTDREVANGTIPTASHLDWQDLVDADTGKMRSAEQLQSLFKRVEFDAEKPTITYCQSGGRASVMAFAMELMGAEQVANYYGSWGEWSKQDAGDQ